MLRRLLYANNKVIFDQFRLFTSKMGKKSAIVLLSEGSEEMELVISADVLRRGGIDVTVAGVQGNQPHECSRQVKIAPDSSLEEAIAKAPYDVVVLPGGLTGSQVFAESSLVGKLLKEQESSGRIIAAICAAPTALKAHGVALGKTVTCYPSLEKELMEGEKYKYSNDNVVVDGNVITSRGPGTAFDFGLKIVENLIDKNTANEVAKGMLL